MNLTETAKLLALAAAYDQRTIGQADVAAWHEVLAETRYEDAQVAVKRHYRASRARIMPADIVDGVRAVANDRAQASLTLPPLGAGAPMPAEVREALATLFAADTPSKHPPADLEARRVALSVRCPYCGQGRGQGCVSTVDGRAMTATHPSRFDAASVGSQ